MTTNTKTMMTKGMKYDRVETVPGQTILRLTAEWAGLSKGTEVRPLSSGNHSKYGHERTVVVLSGDSAGKQVTGPF